MADLEYGYQCTDGKRHIWWLRGPSGGVHISAIACDEESRQRWGDWYVGGIECHSRKPLYESDGQEPHHDPCWLLEGPCWHDGSSLQFSEQIEPIMRHVDDLRTLDEFMNGVLLDRYRCWFRADVDDVEPELI